MSIVELIEKLRNKPEIERRRILVGVTFSVTAIIFFMWLSVKLYNMSSLNLSDEDTSTVSSSKSNPLEEVSDAIGTFINVVDTGITKAKETLNPLISSSTDYIEKSVSSDGTSERIDDPGL